MKKTLMTLIVCLVLLVGLCGCGSKKELDDSQVQDIIIGNTYTNEEERNDETFGKVTTTISITFNDNGKGKEVIKVKTSNSSSSDPITYDMNYFFENNEIKVTTGESIITLKYDKNSKCLIDVDKESREFC